MDAVTPDTAVRWRHGLGLRPTPGSHLAGEPYPGLGGRRDGPAVAPAMQEAGSSR